MQKVNREQVKLLHSVLKESFGNAINGFPKLEYDPAKSLIKGQFRSGGKLYDLEMNYKTGKHSYRLLTENANRDAADDIRYEIPVPFYRGMDERSDAKECKTGTPCGNTCISSKDKCILGMSGRALGQIGKFAALAGGAAAAMGAAGYLSAKQSSNRARGGGTGESVEQALGSFAGAAQRARNLERSAGQASQNARNLETLAREMGDLERELGVGQRLLPPGRNPRTISDLRRQRGTTNRRRRR